MKTKTLFIGLFLFLLSFEIHSQDFKVSPLIDIPGDNIEFDVLSQELTYFYQREVYICWINKLDSVYTIYLKQMSPVEGENIIIASDTIRKSKPQVSFNLSSDGIKIAWQSYENSKWLVYARNYSSGQLSEPFIVLDSLEQDPQMSLSNGRVAWIENGNLLVKEFYPELSAKIIFDSVNCSSPDLVKNDWMQSTQVVYEKHYADSVNICLLEYQHNENQPPVFISNMLSHGEKCRRPAFGITDEITYEVFLKEVWCSRYSFPYWWAQYFMTTGNDKCNYNNPFYCTYPIFTESETDYTPYFLAFDSDSLAGNREIFILASPPEYWQNTFFNLSQDPGDDSCPSVFITSEGDSMYVIVAWYHTAAGKTDIWMGKDIFNPNMGAVEDEDGISTFVLYQNYPNPFNPSTNIEFNLKEKSRVKISLLNILGEELSVLADGEMDAGNHHIRFSAGNLSAGVYFYKLACGSSVQTKKMILIK